MLVIFKRFTRIIIPQNNFVFKQLMLLAALLLNISSAYATNDHSLAGLVADFEKKYNIPRKLLWSIAKVESGTNQFALNVQGKVYLAKSKVEAIEIVQKSLALGISNIDIGLMQINWRYHGQNFTNSSELLDINNNIEYAASFLKKLYKVHGSWKEAVQHYHSANPEHHLKYAKKVLVTWIVS